MHSHSLENIYSHLPTMGGGYLFVACLSQLTIPLNTHPLRDGEGEGGELYVDTHPPVTDMSRVKRYGEK